MVKVSNHHDDRLNLTHLIEDIVKITLYIKLVSTK